MGSGVRGFKSLITEIILKFWRLLLTRSEAGKLGYEKSRHIREENRRIRIEEYYLSPKICEHCGKVIDYSKKKNRFCSHSCAAKKNNLGVIRNKGYQGNLIRPEKDRFCLYCGNKTVSKYSEFCSIKCYHIFTMFESVLAGIAPSRTIKRYLLHINGNKCSECGISLWNGKDIVMELEHKNGDSSNNSLENVCLLCPNCHSQTPTYKSKNIGNGRAERRKRYKEGKSY